MIIFLEEENSNIIFNGRHSTQWIEISSMYGALVTISLGYNNMENEVVALSSFSIEDEMNRELEEFIIHYDTKKPSWVGAPVEGFLNYDSKEATTRWLDFERYENTIIVTITESLQGLPKSVGHVTSYSVRRPKFEEAVTKMRELWDYIENERKEKSL